MVQIEKNNNNCSAITNLIKIYGIEVRMNMSVKIKESCNSFV